MIRIYTGSSDVADALVENESEVKRIVSEIDGFKAAGEVVISF